MQQIFDEQICKVDSGFFHRLKESAYWLEDKKDEYGGKIDLPYSLFMDKEYTDVEYHKEYPTIYHLRSALLHEDKTFDVRLVYLAVAHILRHRGHFLSRVGTDGNINFEESFQNFISLWNEMMEADSDVEVDTQQILSIQKILQDRRITKTKKKEVILKELPNVSKEMKEAVSLLVGGKVSLVKLFHNPDYGELEENKICFDEPEYEEKEEYYALNLGNDFELISKMRELYNWSKLAELMRGNVEGYFSDIKKADYDKHKKDLKVLKDLLKGSHDLYKRTFGVPQSKEANYSRYIGQYSVGKEKKRVDKKCSKEDFYKFLESQILPSIPESVEKQYIQEELKQGTFLPKQRVGENAIVPYQIHESELRQILKNAEQYLLFLKAKDESGFSNSEKIVQLLNFRIPYYIGPLNEKSPYAWVVKKSHEKVTPWNFYQVVDEEESAERFIMRATSMCTYLHGEKVLPESSLLYEKFKVLNELNNVTIKGQKLDVALKQRIYHELYERRSVVNMKKFLSYIRCHTEYTDVIREDIGGIAGDFKAALKSYHAFKKEFTDLMPSEWEKEDIIKDMTVFGSEIGLLKKRLIKKYPMYEKQLNALIRNYRCAGWGRLSEKLLSGIAFENEYGERVRTIIYQLWNTQKNLNEILFDSQYPFGELVDEENKQGEEQDENSRKGKINYSQVKDLYVSPAVKRQIWKAIQVVEEVRHAMGCDPQRIFVEMAREHQKSTMTVSRKRQLGEWLKGETELLEELSGKTDDQLRKDKLYLYFTQLGRCAYTGERIDVEDLLENNDLYDIDHIYPQSLTADDSLDNRVLVRKIENKRKNDIYPIDATIQKRMHAMWNIWYKKGLISQEKYRRLNRITELTEEELMHFVNRQLVETRQGTKAFMDVIKSILPTTEFVYVKAGNVSRFRRDYDMLKSREVNDFHHAQDAYLNIVVGNVYYMKFTKDIRKFFAKNGIQRTYNLNRMFDYNLVVGAENVWCADKGQSISKVKRVLENKKVLVSRQTYSRQGALFDLQPVRDGNALIPLKSGKGDERKTDTGRYGGYNSATITYYSLIAGKDKKGKMHVRMVPVPLYLMKKIEDSTESALAFYAEKTGLREISIKRAKIYMQTLFIEEGFRMRLAGKSDNRVVFHNANELVLEKAYIRVVRIAAKYASEKNVNKNAKVHFFNGVTEKDFDILYESLQKKLSETIYKEKGKTLYDVMEAGKERYLALSPEDKAIVVMEILKFFRCNAEMPSLKLIGGAEKGTPIRISEDVTERKTLAIIHQSVTGLYEVIERVNG